MEAHDRALWYSDISNGDSIDSVPPASHYALLIALKALKDRCDKEHRVANYLLNENRKLDLEKDCERTNLLNKIDQLERHNQQLNHHIFKVVTESKDLCEEVERLGLENKKLSRRIDQLESLNKSGAKSEDDHLTDEGKDANSFSEDEDSDVSILTATDSTSNEDNSLYDIEEDVLKILQNLKKEKSMLQELQVSIASTISKIDCQNVKEQFKQLEVEPEKCHLNRLEEDVPETCPTCLHTQLNSLADMDSLNSFEIITCRCK